MLATAVQAEVAKWIGPIHDDPDGQQSVRNGHQTTREIQDQLRDLDVAQPRVAIEEMLP